jgi:2-succinyl-6-hydroxy-2,4-cyclohexadiene-1-carboxylate synthase
VLLYSETDGTGPRVVLVHGFTQTSRCWGPVAEALAADHEVVRVDAPGHGRSAEVMAGPRGSARLIADRGGQATYLGYSMGGRFCLHLALGNPELVDGLILIGATPGIEDPEARDHRVADDERMALVLERRGLETFLDAWLANPLFAGLPPDRQYREERLRNTVEGLAMSLRQAGTGTQDPLWGKLGRLTMPVLVVAGERDEKFAGIGARMAAAIGENATLALVAGAGHAAHLEQPDAFLAIVEPWLAERGL